ncbi:MAG: N-acetyltransferase [Deltaproteobacteria bacterium]|nr:N-acetyltransferase [Deltaproteobacteria bacterium]
MKHATLPTRDITSKVILGANCQADEGVVLGYPTGRKIIREENRIGDHFTLWSNAVVDYGCQIGHEVKIHANCYIAQFTTIEDKAFLAPGVIVANDLHPGCRHSQDCMTGPTIKEGAQIGVNATILPFITIGEYAVIGSGTVVVKDVPPRSVVVGNPGRVVRSVDDLKCETGLTDYPYR